MSGLSRLNPLVRFSGLAEVYARCRPTYPDAAIDCIMSRTTLGPRMRELSAAVRLADLSVSLPLAVLRASGWFRRYSTQRVNDFGGPI